MAGMEARDFRSIGRAAQEELRRRALFLVERRGLSQGRAAQRSWSASTARP
jgi:transposase